MFGRLLLLAVSAALATRVVQKLVAAPAATATAASSGARRLVRDPVCGAWVAPSTAVELRLNGTAHHFCSPTCRGRFEG